MTKQSGIQALMQAVQQYFNLMYDSDVSHFDRVFRPTAQLHGLRDGKMRMLTAQAYREILAGAPSPRSQGARREEEILLVDITSPSQALAKVRVRIYTIVYVDYLSYHHVDDEWLISSKAFHVESNSATAT
jgi:DNA-dependent RNA polymerase auxiliary subunit epsilon